MSILNLLMYINAALALVIWISILMSNRRQKGRVSSLAFSLTLLGSAGWVAFVGLFRDAAALPEAVIFVNIFSVIALLMPLGCFAYAMTLIKRKTIGVILTTLVFLIETAVAGLILTHNDLFIKEIVMLPKENHAILAGTPLVYLYGAVFIVFLITAVVVLLTKSLQDKQNYQRKGLGLLAGGLIVSASFDVIFSFLLPALGENNYFWAGPLSNAFALVVIYFVALRYRLFTNSHKFLRYATYFVAVVVAALIYVALFYLMFMLIFRGASPSFEIVVLQLVVVTVVILCMPPINHLIQYIKQLINDNGTALEEKK